MVVLCRAVVCAVYQLLALTPVSEQTHSPGGQLWCSLFILRQCTVSMEMAAALLEEVTESQGWQH